MKLIICMLITAITTFLGKKLGDYYIERAELFQELATFSKEVKRLVSFSKSPISSIKGRFSSRVESFVTSPSTVGGIVFFKKDERGRIGDFFSKLGRLDSASELESVKDIGDYFDEKCKVTQLEREKKAPFCVKLGFLIGLFILILVV